MCFKRTLGGDWGAIQCGLSWYAGCRAPSCSERVCLVAAPRYQPRNRSCFQRSIAAAGISHSNETVAPVVSLRFLQCFLILSCRDPVGYQAAADHTGNHHWASGHCHAHGSHGSAMCGCSCMRASPRLGEAKAGPMATCQRWPGGACPDGGSGSESGPGGRVFAPPGRASREASLGLAGPEVC